jgi:transcriptional regulator with XRE-family HTH domain
VRQNVSRAVRFLRRRVSWTQSTLGERARMSRETVSRLERGAIDSLTIGSLERVANALGAVLVLDLRWEGERLERLMDAGHARLQEAAVRGLRAGDCSVEVEVSFNWYGDRGRYDALAFHPPTGTLIVVEVKTRLGDVQDLLGRLDVKLRLAPQAARAQGWPQPLRVVPCLLVAEGRTARRVVADHPELFARFALRGRDARRWLANPSDEPVSGILLFESVPDSRRTDTRQSAATRPQSHSRRR